MMATDEAVTRTIRYRGRTKAGRATSGSTRTDDLGAWVEQRWRQGWRYLVVTEGDIEVAGISVLDGTWWSER